MDKFLEKVEGVSNAKGLGMLVGLVEQLLPATTAHAAFVKMCNGGKDVCVRRSGQCNGKGPFNIRYKAKVWATNDANCKRGNYSHVQHNCSKPCNF
jgi:hypothetical protein